MAPSGGLASNRSLSATSSKARAAATSPGPAMRTTFITATPKRALISPTRSTLSMPWSCSMSGRATETMPSRVSSSASTTSPTRVTEAGTFAPNSAARSGLTERGDGG